MQKNYVNIAKQVLETEKEALANLTNLIDDNFNTAIETILKAKGKVIVTGIGKSGHIGRKIAASFASTGTPSFFLHPSEALHGDLGMIGSDDIVLAIANSGETPEILNIIPFTKDNNISLIAISSNPESTLAQKATIHLNIGKFKEACPLSLAPTTSSTLTLVMGDALMVALMDGRGFDEESYARFHPGGNLGKRLLTRVGHIMQSENLPFIMDNYSMSEIIYTINAGRCGLGIVGTPNSVKGIITDGDLRRAMDTHKEAFFNLNAMEVMTKNPQFITADTKLLEAKKIMNSKKITSLLVGNSEQIDGLIQLHDINI